LENYDIGFAKKTDIQEILIIKKEAHETFVANRPDIYKSSEVLYTNDFLKGFCDRENKHIAVVRKDSQIIAYAFIQINIVKLPMLTNRKFVYLHDMAVLNSMQHQGIATGLLEFIEHYAISIGASSLELAVHLFSDHAMSLYKKRGFNARAIRMEKPLNVGMDSQGQEPPIQQEA